MQKTLSFFPTRIVCSSPSLRISEHPIQVTPGRPRRHRGFSRGREGSGERESAARLAADEKVEPREMTF